MHCAALIWSETQHNGVALVFIVFWLDISRHFSLQTSSARLLQARVKSSNLERVVRCWLNLFK